MEPLNLAGADLKAFEAVDAGAYAAEVARAEWKGTKGDGKMPKDTPMLNIGFKLTEDGVEGQWVWGQWVLPTKEYEKAEKDKSAKMKGMFARMLTNLGYSEEDVLSGNFDLSDPDELIGRECVVRVDRREYPPGSDEFTNSVKGVKPAGSPTSAGSGASII